MAKNLLDSKLHVKKEKPMADEEQKTLPLNLNGVPIGEIDVNMETGTFEGRFSKEYLELIVDFLGAQVMEFVAVIKPSFPIDQEDVNQKIKEFLEKN
jgi:hypothetical protein